MFNNTMYHFIETYPIFYDLGKCTLIVIYGIIFKYFLTYGITLYCNDCLQSRLPQSPR